MLIRFNVENFMSFKKNQEFSTIAGKVTNKKEHLYNNGKLKLLKFCSIYGANASGKSNLVKAIAFGKNVLLKGISNLSGRKKYFRCKPECKNQDSIFEYEIHINNKTYAYGFKIQLFNETITGEWLYEIDEKEERMIFERTYIKEKNSYDIEDRIHFSNEVDKLKFKVYKDDILNMQDTLLVSEICRKNLEGIKDFKIFYDIFFWFKNSLIIIYPHSLVGGSKHFFSDKYNDQMIELLNYFDTGIVGYHKKSISFEELTQKIPHKVLENIVNTIEKERISFKTINIFKKIESLISTNKSIFNIVLENDDVSFFKLLFNHHSDNDESLFDLFEESDGTRRLIDLLEVILADGEDKTFIIDELDHSLHPQLTRKFVETFLKIAIDKKLQLVVTTHESSLLDLKLLRRDEVWFVERDDEKKSKIFSLDEFKERYDKIIEKAYLKGRYGAVPVFKNFKSFVSNK